MSADINVPVIGAVAWYHRGLVNFDEQDALKLLDDGKGTPINLYIGAAPVPRDNGGPAFPSSDQQAAHAVAMAASVAIEDATERERAYIVARGLAQQGMTLRALFASKAMQACVEGHISHFGHDNHWPPVDVAQYSCELADALIAELAK